MFKRFTKRIGQSRREYDRRKELVTAVAKLILHDTDRVIDEKQIALEASVFGGGFGVINESYYAHIQKRYGISDPMRTAKNLSDDTLNLLLERYRDDTSGLNQLVRDAMTAWGEKEIFYRERLMYPVEFHDDRIETSRTYRETRHALGATDMSALPAERHGGIMALLGLGSFWASYLCDYQLELGLSGDTCPPQELVELILEMPERVEDIIDYIRDHEVALTDIEFNHLREVLTTESKPFGVGVL